MVDNGDVYIDLALTIKDLSKYHVLHKNNHSIL